MSRKGRIFLLGGVRAARGSEVVALAGTQPRLLLAYTVLQRGRAVPNDELAGVLWADGPARHWEGALRGVVAKVRSFLAGMGEDAPTLDTVAQGYRFVCGDPTIVDVWWAETTMAHAEEALALGCFADAAAAAHRALDLLSGPLLSGVDAEWITPWRGRLDRDRRRAGRLASAAHVALGQFDEAIAAASGAVADDELDEASQRALMVAFQASGNRAAALRSYGRCRRLLAEELGLAPDVETEALYVGLLAPDGGSGPPSADHVPVAAFVGRGEQLAALGAAWEEASLGRGQVVLLHGESGVGKTRLVLEAARRAGPEHVLYGRSSMEQVVPFEPFAEALGHHLAAVGEDELAELVDPYGDDLAGLAPEIAGWDRCGAPVEPAVGRAVDHRPRVFEAVSTVIGRIATAPTILVLDDLHWADGATLLLLRRLLPGLARARLLVIATYRDDLVASAELGETLGELTRRDGCRMLALGGLDEAAVLELLRASDVPDAEAHTPLWRERTGGNGFYLTQVLMAWAESTCVDHRHVPDTVNELVRHRVATLSAPARDVLAAAAVVGTTVAREILDRAVTLGAGEPAAVGELVDRNLLRADASGELAFTHGIVRDAVYDQLPRSRRRRLHLRVAQAIAELHPDDPERGAARAWHHLVADDPLPDPEPHRR